MAGQLDVNDQLIDYEQFPLDRNSSCPTILSALFGLDLGLVLYRRLNQCDVIRVIYAFCCRLCDQNDPYEFNPGNNSYINYVGQSVRSVHEWVCGEHGVGMKGVIINTIANRNVKELPKYKHGANHFCNNGLPQEAQGTHPRDAFREVIALSFCPLAAMANLVRGKFLAIFLPMQDCLRWMECTRAASLLRATSPPRESIIDRIKLN